MPRRPQGKSYLYFTQFKAEVQGAEIEYGMAYVSGSLGGLRGPGGVHSHCTPGGDSGTWGGGGMAPCRCLGPEVVPGGDARVPSWQRSPTWEAAARAHGQGVPGPTSPTHPRWSPGRGQVSHDGGSSRSLCLPKKQVNIERFWGEAAYLQGVCKKLVEVPVTDGQVADLQHFWSRKCL